MNTEIDNFINYISRGEYQHLEAQTRKIRDFTESEKRKYFSTAVSPYTFHKNRYSDVLPLESTRVRLKPIDSLEGSDYINASYLLGSQYISCQAPLSNTLSDFWRMIWEQNSRIIVMLTKFVESGKSKAQVYWPNRVMETCSFDGISVTLLSEEISESFTVRNIQLRKEKELRTIHHLHYTDWPDFGIPNCTKGIIDLCEKVNILMKLSNEGGPIVVHCSAGLGRSGSFIGIHFSLNLLTKNSRVHILSLILQMRKDRIGMVQTEKQYEFIYRAICEHFQDKIDLKHLADEESRWRKSMGCFLLIQV